MKRKLITYLITGIIYLVIGLIFISQVYCSTKYRRLFVECWIQYAKGEFDTNITVLDSENQNYGMRTAYCDGKYYFYDKEKKGICEYNTGTLLVPLQEAPKGLAASEKYIYYAVDSGIYQLNYQGKVVSDFQFPEVTVVKELYLNSNILYCKCAEHSNDYTKFTEAVYFFDAENLSKKCNIGETDKDWKKLASYEHTLDVGILERYIKRIGNDWLVVEDAPDRIRFSDDGLTAKIYVEDNYGGAFELLSGDDGKAMFCAEENIMAVMNDNIYISETSATEIGRLKENKSWKQYGEQLDTSLNRSRMKIDEDFWIILYEEYGGCSAGTVSEGSIGEYMNAALLYVDLKADEVSENIPIKTGQVIYMDKEQYATFRNGRLEFYRVADGEKIKEHKVEKYQLRKDYLVEFCYDKLFFFCEDKLIDVIEV